MSAQQAISTWNPSKFRERYNWLYGLSILKKQLAIYAMYIRIFIGYHFWRCFNRLPSCEQFLIKPILFCTPLECRDCCSHWDNFHTRTSPPLYFLSFFTPLSFIASICQAATISQPPTVTLLRTTKLRRLLDNGALCMLASIHDVK